MTVVVRRRARPDAVEAFERWMDGIVAATAGFPGHLGSSVARPAPDAVARQDYVVIFRFASADELAAWEASPERAEWLAKGEPLTAGEARVEKVTGLEYWFTRSLPAGAATRPPPAWKMALVTLTGLFPLVLVLPPRLKALAARSGLDLPDPLVTLGVVALIVALMTWLVMPALVRLARPWLFPK